MSAEPITFQLAGHPQGDGSSDFDRALGMARLLFPDEGWFRHVVIDGNPPSKARPRRGRGGHFYSPSKAEEKVTAAALKQGFPAPIEGNLGIACMFFRANRQRIDADNMMKHVMDAATGICWRDDSQVTAQLGIVELDAARPRTIVVVGPHTSTMIRPSATSRICAHCGQSFLSPMQNAKFCSRTCASHSRGDDLRALVSCSHCGKDFRRRTAGQRYCSDDCRLAALTNRRRAAALPLPKCPGCGKTLSKHGYGLCRDCWRSARPA